MLRHHFISYSNADGLDFAYRLHDALEADGLPAWLDKRDLKPGLDWDTQIRDSIRDSITLLFAITPDSVTDMSVCHDEWSLALKYKKPIIPLCVDRAAEAPFRLQNRQYIDFTGGFDAGIASLRQHLRWMNSPEGLLQVTKDRLKDAERDLRRAVDEIERERIEDEIAQLKKDIARQQAVVADPQAANARTQASIEAGLQRVRQPERPVSGESHVRFINSPPMTPPNYFQDRFIETRFIADFLRDDALRLLTVVGRGGNGKTAIVCRLLKELEIGYLPDDLGPLAVDGIVYLSYAGPQEINVPNLISDLCKLLPADIAAALEAEFGDTQASTKDKLLALLARFPTGRVIVLLDNFEDGVEPETNTIRDADLDEALRTLLDAPHHAVKLILTTRVKPRPLLLLQGGRQRVLELDAGLESPYAENLLREMDSDGRLGLQTLAPNDPLLHEARERTRGFPRALEALFAILAADRNTSLRELLDEISRREAAGGAAHLLPDSVVQVMVGEAFNRLDPPAQQVIQALAIYSRPVPPVAVDYLLQPYVPGIDSTPILGRLVNMHFVRKESGTYYLHPIDQAYVLSLIEQDVDARSPEMGVALFTRKALLVRGAGYFHMTRQPRAGWKTLHDLQPQLAEIDLRCAMNDFDTAASVLVDIDTDYLWLWGHFHLMAELHERLQNQITDKTLKCISLSSLGLAYHSLGHVRRAIGCYQQALAIAREIGDRRHEGGSLGNLGWAHDDLGDAHRAIEYHEQALAIARQIGHRRDEGRVLINLGNAFHNLGQAQRAPDLLEQALNIAHETNDRFAESSCLGNLGNVYYTQGEVRRAGDFFEQALAIAREIGDRRGGGVWLGNLGNVYTTLGELWRAGDSFEQALATARAIGDRRSEGVWLGNLGIVYTDLGEMQSGIELFRQALDIARAIGDRSGEGRNLVYLGSALIDIGEWEQARQFCREAADIADEIGDVQIQHYGREELALINLYTGDLAAARTAAEEARRHDLPRNNYYALVLLGVIALRQGDHAAARDAFAVALSQADALLALTAEYYDAQDAKGLALCGLALGEGEHHIPTAIEAFRAARAIISASGVVARVLQLFDALAAADVDGLLEPVRAVIVGE